MSWMPTPDEQTCRLVSSMIYRLTRPADSKASDATQFAFSWRQDARGVWLMRMPDEMVLPIHAGRSAETAETLALFVQAGSLSADSAAAIATLVRDRVGRTVTLGEVIPPEWRAQMIEAPDWPVAEA